MKLEKITKESIQQVTDIYYDKNLTWDERMSKIMEIWGVSERTARRRLVKLGLKEKNKIVTSKHFEDAKKKQHDKKKKMFLISWAQNNTSVHSRFLKNMEAYAKHIDAEILIIPGRYNNQTQTLEKNTDESWASEVVPYLSANRHNLNKSISVFSDIKVQATAVNPLNSLESLTTENSCVVGHPRVHLKILPTLDLENPKIILSTGACTKPNFTDSKIGKIGNFHHTLGFAIVEIKDNEKFFVRQITAIDEDGSFSDLYFDVKDEKVTRIKNVLTLVKGDIHYGSHDEEVLKRSFEELIPKINPREIILHDIFDGLSINHHEANNFIKQYHNEVSGKNSLRQEIDNLMAWLETIKKYNLVVVFSNHDDFLNRFIINADIKKNVKNALEYVEFAKILLENKAPNGLIAYLINQKFKKIKCLGRNDSYKVGGWELGIHGMDGVNGSRGSVQQYRKLNSKIISAHAHSPCRLDGTLQVGTNTQLRMGYNNGVSTWAHSDVIIHMNKKSQHIIYVGKGREFTTFK